MAENSSSRPVDPSAEIIPSIVRSQLRASARCNRRNKHTGLLECAHLRTAHAASNPRPVKPELGMSVRLTKRRFGRRTIGIVVQIYDLETEEYSTVGWCYVDRCDGKDAFRLVGTHEIRGEIEEVMDGGIKFVVRYEASQRCGPFL